MVQQKAAWWIKDEYTSEEREELVRLGKEHYWLQNHQLNDLAAPGAYRIMTRGEGNYIYDIEGNKYIDAMAGLFMLALGHGRQEIVDAAAEQMSTLAYVNSAAFSSVPAIQLSAKLAELTPGDLNRVFFCGGGSEAVEIALKMARQYWQNAGAPNRRKFISRRGQYHGSTWGAMSLTGRAQYHGAFEPMMSGTLQTEMPYCYRCPWGFDRSNKDCCMLTIRSLKNLIEFEGPDTIAAFVATPIPAGNQIPPEEYWPQVTELLAKHNILLIADEIICGFGRLGRWFGMERFGVTPDIMVVAKALTAGYLPVGGAIASKKVADTIEQTPQGFMHGVTYGSHPAVMAAGLKTLELMERLNVVENAEQMGNYLYERAMAVLAENHPSVGYVGGGMGLLMHIEMVKNRKTKEKHAGGYRSEFALRFTEKVRGYGLAIRAFDNVVISPPLTIDKGVVDDIIDILDKTMGEMEKEFPPQV